MVSGALPPTRTLVAVSSHPNQPLDVEFIQREMQEGKRKENWSPKRQKTIESQISKLLSLLDDVKKALKTFLMLRREISSMEYMIIINQALNVRITAEAIYKFCVL